MPIPSTINDLSTTASSNSPQGADAFATDDYLRAIQAIIKTQDNLYAQSLTAWSNFTPIITSGGGTLGATLAGARYKQIGKTVFCNYDIAINGIGSGSGFIKATVPVTANLTALFSGCGRNRTTGDQLQVIVDTSTTIAIFKYDNTFPVSGDFQNMTVSFTFEAA